jgi:hypothetical protein
MENEPEVIAQENDTETTENTEEVVLEEVEDESVEDLKKRLATTEAQKEHWRKKAREQKEIAPREETVNTTELSTKDVLFLAKADVHEDDVNELLEWAKFKKVSVQDAYKQLKGTLDVRAEERRTASMTNTKKSARGTSEVSGENLLAKAQKTGEVPETTEGLQALFMARRASGFKK